MKGIIFGAIIVGVSSTAMARPELNAFINKPANSIPELLAQIKSDKQVSDRFMRHFSMSKEEVLEYVGSLHLGSLQQSGYFTIYSAPDSGIIKAHISFFKKGTPAFVDSDGNAILRVKCANPFVAGPVKPFTTSTPSVSDHNSDVLPVTPESAIKSDSLTASFTPPEPQRPDVETPVSLRTTPINTSPGQFAGSSLASIIGLGGAAIFVNKGGGKTPSVPEPTSMIAIAVGVGALARKRKKK
jgi:hypothetical protein